jgi:hypothetical protein
MAEQYHDPSKSSVRRMLPGDLRRCAARGNARLPSSPLCGPPMNVEITYRGHEPSLQSYVPPAEKDDASVAVIAIVWPPNEHRDHSQGPCQLAILRAARREGRQAAAVVPLLTSVTWSCERP